VCDYIVAVGFFCQFHQLAVTARGASYLVLLSQINCVFGRDQVIRATGLDFDERKRVGVISDNVYLPRYFLPANAAPYGDAKVCW
jgi:hypothetical protein